MDDVEVDFIEDKKDKDDIYLMDEDFFNIQNIKRAIYLVELEPLDPSGALYPRVCVPRHGSHSNQGDERVLKALPSSGFPVSKNKSLSGSPKAFSCFPPFHANRALLDNNNCSGSSLRESKDS